MKTSPSSDKPIVPLTITFNSTARDDLYEFFTEFVKAIPEEFIMDPNDQCLITVNGDPDSGKSMLWDIIRKIYHTDRSRLADSSITESHRVNRPSKAAFADIRMAETYDGDGENNTNPLRLLFVNAHGLTTYKEDAAKELLAQLVELENSIANDDVKPAPELGNIIVLNNVMGFNGFKGKNTPVKIEITDPTMSWAGANTHWNRKTTLEINHPALLASPAIQTFVQRFG